MLKLDVVLEEGFDEVNNKFVPLDVYTIEMEHSLASLSKWESKFEKPFLGDVKKTNEEMLFYIEAMVLTPEVPPYVWAKLSQKNVDSIQAYIDAKMTATWFSESTNKPSPEIITAEVIYYWMVSLNIPFECQYWHLNRLLTLVRVCNEKNAPKKKLSSAEIGRRQKELNRKRQAELGTSG